MPNKFSRTEVIDGELVVSLFATGVKCIARQIEMLDELLMNNLGSDPVCNPATSARKALLLLVVCTNSPKPRSGSAPSRETVEDLRPETAYEPRE